MSERDDLIEAQRDWADAVNDWNENAARLARILVYIATERGKGHTTAAEQQTTRLLNLGTHTRKLHEDVERAQQRLDRATQLLRMTTARAEADE